MFFIQCEQENLFKNQISFFFYEEKLAFLKLSLPGNNFILAIAVFFACAASNWRNTKDNKYWLSNTARYGGRRY